MTRTKSSRALLSVVLAVLMVAAFMPALTYSSFAATAKKATKVTKLTHTGAKVYGKVGNKYVLKYKLSPSKLTSAAKKTVWKSSDSKVVKVYSTKSNRAAVKALKSGTAKVTVYTKANKKAKATWTFKVTKKAATKKTTELTGVTVSAPNSQLDLSKDVTVGTVLKASVAPADAENVTYQWYANDTAISGATDSSYTVTAAEIGKTITVKATSKNEVASTATAKVATPTMFDVTVANQTNKATAAAPAIGDVLKATANVKSTLTTGEKTYETSEVTYQWYRGSIDAKNAISGATSQTYTVAAADAEKELFVVATPKAGVAGYPKFVSAGTVKKAAKTATLTATTDGTNVTATVKDSKGNDVPASNFDYQWAESKDGTNFTAISATNPTYAPNKADKAGYTYKVTVTPKSTSEYGLDKTSATVKFTGKSLSSATEGATVFNVTSNVRGDATATNKIGDELQVKIADGKSLTYGTDYTVTWYRSDKDNSNTADKAFNPATSQNLGTSQSYKLTSSDVAGTYLYAVVTGAGDYAGQTVTLPANANVQAAASAYTLSYDSTKKALVVKDSNGNTIDGANYNLYAYKNGTTTASTATFTNAAAAEGYTYFVTAKTGDSKVKSNGITFVSGQDPASVTVSGLVTITSSPDAAAK